MRKLDDAVRGFVGSGGFPDPVGDEVAVFFAFEPHTILEGLPFPRSIGAAQAMLTLDRAGGAGVRFHATSTTPQQAKLDAAYLERMIEEVSTIELLSFRFRVLDHIRFRADGNQVRSDIHFEHEEISWLVGFALGGS